ncbi:glycosyltransferase family 2 protein [Pseudomonas abietaniphila]|uniref:Glycosyltransferase involved in cell wall bisynthesis n=1 Tax=Pseudomonas abietaniphila TaxID=89065 RepID=A0A1G8BSM4_9PSED|nr:glycosyltransferase family 2 protein [Pseudomonas abietaniphila]SDH36098.1 Glycosyltransferase involved in cell wall bisynthesis [Pseudomonas abietaniphila]
MSQEFFSGSKLRALLGIKLGVLFQHAPRSYNLAVPSVSGTSVLELPSISIVTPSYNQGQFIERTVRSVLDQGYSNLEMIVQDNCSADNTDAVMRSIKSRSVRYFRERDGGQADAINRGFEKTAGEIMCYLNSDDVLMPGTLDRVGRFFADHPEVDVLYGNRLIIDETDALVGEWVLPYHDGELLRRVDYVPQETLFWRRSLWSRAGGRVDDKLAFAMDWDLLLRFAEADARFVHLPDFLGGFRVHAAQKTSSHYQKIGVHEMRIIRNRYAPRAFGKAFMPIRHCLFLLKHIYSTRNGGLR